MCSGGGSSSSNRSSSKVTHLSTMPSPSPRINGRPVLQPTSNRNNNNNNNNNGRSTNTNNNNNSSTSPSSNKKLLLPPISPSPSPASSIMPPSPKSRCPKLRGASIDSTTNKKDQVDALFRPPGVRSDLEIITTTTAATTIKKSKSFNGRTTTTTTTMTAIADGGYGASNLMRYSSSSPGSLAAIRREQMALQQAQRKMRIAHYGRSKSARFDSKIVPLDYPPTETQTRPHEEKRCSFITPNSDPLYVAYHDEEWGVPVHDDNLLFELLVLSGAQVGSDWTSILSKRQDFRNAFSGFDAEKVATYSDKQITAISSEYGIDVGRVHGVVDNSKCILKVKREFGSLKKYVWSFVNNKPIATQYKASHKIPVKTSKSESISKDMIRKGFRNVGPTVVLSFMQAAGLTNDHLVTCHCHLKCASLASTPTPASTITLN